MHTTPRTVFAAIENYDGFTVTTAIFFEREAAAQFARDENDQVQAELVTIEPIVLVDRYGFPCTVADLPLVAPWTLLAPGEEPERDTGEPIEREEDRDTNAPGELSPEDQRLQEGLRQ